MDVILLSRLQFAVAIFFHFIFVPLTIGLAVLLVYMETRYVMTGDEMWKRMTKFWGKLFLINFTLGVVTGITLEFQFGTNWSRYSIFVGDIFGSLLAIEATVAFFLESTFLAIWAFGWNKVGKKVHLMCIWFVAIASNMSAVWIILANGWMQNPVGHVIRNNRAELDNFYTVITNPYAWGLFLHNAAACWMLGGFFVLGVSAWHLIRDSHTDFFRRSFKVAAPFTLVMALLLIYTGHHQGTVVAKYQPAKLAAMEAHWETASNVPMNLLVIPNPAEKNNYIEAFPIPGFMSWLSYGDANAEIKGMNDFPAEDLPPINIVFYSFRTMVALGSIFLLMASVAFYLRNKEEFNTKIMRALIWLIPFPYIAIILGWTVTEVGRQPWIVYGLMRTSEGVSPIPAGNVAISLIAFIVVYSVLGLLDVYLIRKYAIKGPAPRKVQ